MDPSLLTKTAVTNRPGWSATLVARLLGEPDQRQRISGYKSSLALYALARVEQAEASAAFHAAQAALATRRAAAQKAVATKTTRLMAAVEAMRITVARRGLPQVQQSAIAHYNHRSDGDAFASPQDSPAFLARVTVNYVRHVLTRYDQALLDIAGKTGNRTALAVIRQRIYAAIADAYPALSAECARQLAERLDQEAERDAHRAAGRQSGVASTALVSPGFSPP